MIFAIDDDPITLEQIRSILESLAIPVVLFEDPEEALLQAMHREPDLIISDIMMPQMTGFDLHRSYQEHFPQRSTPVIFLSALDDDENILKGYETGAVDYITKPVNQRILQAKINAILGLRKKMSGRKYTGTLKDFPLAQIFHFCEENGLTGNLTIEHDDKTYLLKFKAGNLIEESAENILEIVMDLEDGVFHLIDEPVDFNSLRVVNSCEEKHTTEQCSQMNNPPGILSGLRVNKKIIQIQTEISMNPERHIESIVIYDGQVMKSAKQNIDRDEPFENVKALMEKQHQQLQEDIQQKVQKLGETKQKFRDEPEKSAAQLFEEGFEMYRQGLLEDAARLLEAASLKEPDNKTFRTNVAIIKNKLKKKSGTNEKP